MEKRQKALGFLCLKKFLCVFFISLFIFLMTSEGWILKMNLKLNQRGEIWKLGVNTIKKSLFFGKGYLVSLMLVSSQLNQTHFHNSFIDIFAELGIFGVLSFCFIWIFLLKIGLEKLRQSSSPERSLSLALLISFEGSVLIGAFLNLFLLLPFFMFLPLTLYYYPFGEPGYLK